MQVRSRWILTLFLALMGPLGLVSQALVSGKIVDERTAAPLPFASVVMQGSGKGVAADIDGRFQLNLPSGSKYLVFSCIGYISDTILVEGSAPLRVALKASSVRLNEVKYLAEMSEAERWVRKILAKRDSLNPLSLPKWKATVYQRISLSPQADSLLAMTDSLRMKKPDSTLLEVKNMAEKQYFFLNESVIERRHLKPGRFQETIKASRTSGLQNPIISTLTTQMQSLSFYEDRFEILGVSYQNPISKEGLGMYYYDIADTLVQGIDTLLLIQYYPLKSKNPRGIQGQLFINASRVALQSAVASPVDSTGNRVAIVQRYEPCDSLAWFPVQQQLDLHLRSASINGVPMVVQARTYLRNIERKERIRPSDFSAMAVELDEQWEKNSEGLLNTFGGEERESKDSLTYHVMDSVGKEMKLDQRLKGLEALVTGRFRTGIVDWNLNELMRANQYEGFRLGLGLQSNERLISWWQVGGYVAWGFKDMALKWGVFSEWPLHRKSATKLRVGYRQDVVERAATDMAIVPPLQLNDLNRQLAVSVFDSIQETRISLESSPVANVQIQVYGQHRWQNPTDGYRYALGTDSLRRFNLTEVGLSLRWGLGEKYIPFGGTRLALSTDKPVLWFQVGRGISWPVGGQEYTRIQLKIEEKYSWKKWGRSQATLMAGWVPERAPAQVLFNGRGSYTDFSLVSRNAFETMMPAEFIGNYYVYGFINHTFPNWVKWKKVFRPNLSLFHNMGWGGWSNSEGHEGLLGSTLERGYFESGLSVDNLLVLNNSGFGVGVFYRYGANALVGGPGKNVFLKMSISFLF